MTELINKHEHSSCKTHGHKMLCKGAPATIKGLLELLIEDKVTIILKSGEQETVEVEAVVGNLLVASLNCGKVKFIDIDCICAIIVRCEEILEAILGINCGRCHEFGDDD